MGDVVRDECGKYYGLSDKNKRCINIKSDIKLISQ